MLPCVGRNNCRHIIWVYHSPAYYGTGEQSEGDGFAAALLLAAAVCRTRGGSARVGNWPIVGRARVRPSKETKSDRSLQRAGRQSGPAHACGLMLGGPAGDGDREYTASPMIGSGRVRPRVRRIVVAGSVCSAHTYGCARVLRSSVPVGAGDSLVLVVRYKKLYLVSSFQCRYVTSGGL